ncbi:MAG: hypothetical protein WB764_03290 [Xanthobacteraceae bacterium]
MIVPYFNSRYSTGKVSCKRSHRRSNPQCYPQRYGVIVLGGFNLCSRGFAVSSFPDRSRLVLPDVTIAKVGSAWVRGGYQRRTTW